MLDLAGMGGLIPLRTCAWLLEPLQGLDDEAGAVGTAQERHVGFHCAVVYAAAFGDAFGDRVDEFVSTRRHDANRKVRGAGPGASLVPR